MMPTENHLLTIQEGCMVIEAKKGNPVIISVPHDGILTNDLTGLFETRKTGCRGRDVHVWSIAKDILIQSGIHAVRGLMPRAMVDYNRAWPEGINYYPITQKEVHTALDDENLTPAYYHYHNTIDRLVGLGSRKFGKENVLLIDLHGFAKQPPYAPEGGFDLILGTGNRISIPHGNVDQEFAHFMRERNYKVFLPEAASLGKFEDYYSADFTTRHHSEKHKINVIQIEIASRFRASNALELGQKLAQDMADFLVKHVLKEK